MSSISKSFSLLLVLILAVSSLIVAKPALAQTPTPTPQYTPTPTPTIPEPTVSFTLWYTNSPVIQPPANRTADIPPICEIVSPENQTVLQTNFTLKVNVASYFWVIDSVYYEADWIEGIHQIFGVQPNYVDALNASITVNFGEIPDGNHSVTVYANSHDGSHSFAAAFFQIVSSPSPTQTPTLTPTSTSPTPTPTPMTTGTEEQLIIEVTALLGFVVFLSVIAFVYERRKNKRNLQPPL
jgi:hypothetical protein